MGACSKPRTPEIRAPWLARGRLTSLLLLACLLLPACATTRFHERERLTDRAARFDQDDAVAYIRGKLEAAREGALGGFGAAAAGGCGCQ